MVSEESRQETTANLCEILEMSLGRRGFTEEGPAPEGCWGMLRGAGGGLLLPSCHNKVMVPPHQGLRVETSLYPISVSP